MSDLPPRSTLVTTCETCGKQATHYDYDQYKYLCDDHVEQPEFTVEVENGKPKVKS